MSPFKPTQVRSEATRDVFLEVEKRLRMVFVLPLRLGVIHIGRISFPARGPLEAGHTDGGNRRAGRDNGEQRDGRRQRGSAPAPAPHPLRCADRSRPDRLVAKEPAQFFCQFQRGGVAARGVFFEAFQADDLQVAGHARV